MVISSFTKNSVLLVTLAFFGIINAKAQCTPNNSYTVPGIYPDSIPTAYEGVSYTGVINFRTPPPDTSIVKGSITFPVTIDSLVVAGYSGLPNGFTANCNLNGCLYLPDNNGCIAITGTATAQQIGVYPLEVYTNTYFTILGAPGVQNDTARQFVLKVCDPNGCTVGIKENYLSLSELTLAPNPSNSLTQLTFSSERNEPLNLYLIDPLGKTIQHKSITAVRGDNNIPIDVSTLSKGVYRVILSSQRFSNSVNLMVW